MTFRYQIIVVVGIAFLVLGVVLFVLFSSKTTKPNSERLKVAATIYPLYDIARNVAGEEAEVTLILPPGASPHFYEFSPTELRNLQGTDVVFAIGHGLDNWAYKVEEAIPGVEVYIVDQGITLRKSGLTDRAFFNNQGDGVDPHYWLHFGNARKIVNNLQDMLAIVDPEKKAAYAQNAAAYNAHLTAKEEELVEKIIPLTQRKIVTLHDAWFYFANNFNLDIVGTFEPAAGQDPTPKYLADLTKKVRESGATVIFGEPQIATTALQNFANDNFLRLLILDPIGGVGGRKSYVEMMEYNIDVIIGVQ